MLKEKGAGRNRLPPNQPVARHPTAKIYSCTALNMNAKTIVVLIQSHAESGPAIAIRGGIFHSLIFALSSLWDPPSASEE